MNASKIAGVIVLACTASILLRETVYAQNPARESTAGAALPKDVYPDSRFRLPLPKREDLDDYGKRVFDTLVDPGRRSLVGLNGPAGIRMYDPKVADMMNTANLYLRRETGFGDRLTEIAILTTAREMDNQFEWVAHETAGRKAGVEPAVIDIIRYRRPVIGLGEKETIIIRFGRELFGQKKVSSATFAEALRLFGRRGLVDLTSLMASYSATSALLNAFDMQLPEGQKPQLPVPVDGGHASAAFHMERLAGTENPNLNGLWQAFNEANWDIQAHAAKAGPPEFGALFAEPAGIGVVEGNEIPYQPWALAKKKENFEKRFVRVAADGVRSEPLDPEAKCYLPGVPRATYMPFPFQIVQGDKKVVIAYEYAGASRIIPLEDAGPAPNDSYMGWSTGDWEADTLVVNVTGFNDKTWFDRAGNFHSDALHVVERYTPVGADVLRYEATIEDTKVFTRPWKISFPLYRRVDQNAQFLEFKCMPFAEELLYGHLRKQSEK